LHRESANLLSAPGVDPVEKDMGVATDSYAFPGHVYIRLIQASSDKDPVSPPVLVASQNDDIVIANLTRTCLISSDIVFFFDFNAFCRFQSH